MNLKVLSVGLLIVLPLLGLLGLGLVFLWLGRGPGYVDSPLIGKPAPPFSLKPVGGGETASLEALRGKTVVLNFWATWCAPCFEEHGELQRAARTLGPEVKFLGIIYEDEEDRVRGFLRQQGSAYPSLLDDGGKTAIAYGVYGVPETYFISPGGVITSKYAQPLNEATIRGAVQEAQAGTVGGAR